jgi:hypothetical protein
MSLIERGEGLGPMLRHLNQFAKRDLSSAVFYFTLVAAPLDREARILEFAGAGHPPALVVGPGHPPRLLESQRAVLGLWMLRCIPKPRSKFPLKRATAW